MMMIIMMMTDHTYSHPLAADCLWSLTYNLLLVSLLVSSAAAVSFS